MGARPVMLRPQCNQTRRRRVVCVNRRKPHDILHDRGRARTQTRMPPWRTVSPASPGETRTLWRICTAAPVLPSTALPCQSSKTPTTQRIFSTTPVCRCGTLPADTAGRASLWAWVLTITRNLAISRLREHGRTEPLVQEDWQDRLADNPAVTHEDRMMLEAVLSALSDEERQIVTLHALTGLRHREIAALLGLPLPTVLSKYSRALKKLQLAWKEAD